MTTPLGEIREDVPYAYQDGQGDRAGGTATNAGRRQTVAMAYARRDRAPDGAPIVGFDLGGYDATRPLVLDPAVLLYCGYVGGAGDEVGSGIALLNAPAGPTFATLDRVHRYGTYALVVLVVAHVLIAIGVLPGYRGAWRGMHLGGRVPRSTAERLWPASLEDRPGIGDRDVRPRSRSSRSA